MKCQLGPPSNPAAVKPARRLARQAEAIAGERFDQTVSNQ